MAIIPGGPRDCAAVRPHPRPLSRSGGEAPGRRFGRLVEYTASTLEFKAKKAKKATAAKDEV